MILSFRGGQRAAIGTTETADRSDCRHLFDGGYFTAGLYGFIEVILADVPWEFSTTSVGPLSGI